MPVEECTRVRTSPWLAWMRIVTDGRGSLLRLKSSLFLVSCTSTVLSRYKCYIPKVLSYKVLTYRVSRSHAPFYVAKYLHFEDCVCVFMFLLRSSLEFFIYLLFCLCRS